jgi:hypothetical protein
MKQRGNCLLKLGNPCRCSGFLSRQLSGIIRSDRPAVIIFIKLGPIRTAKQMPIIDKYHKDFSGPQVLAVDALPPSLMRRPNIKDEYPKQVGCVLDPDPYDSGRKSKSSDPATSKNRDAKCNPSCGARSSRFDPNASFGNLRIVALHTRVDMKRGQGNPSSWRSMAPNASFANMLGP